MKMTNRKCAAALVLLGSMSLPVICSAEIYGWIDGSGVVTYSNLPPPRGADVTQVIHQEPISPKAQAEVARHAQIEALNDRMRLLEWQLARSRQADVVNYPAAPSAPASVSCGYGDYSCNPDWAAYDLGYFWPYGSGYGYRGRYHGFHSGRGGFGGRVGFGGRGPSFGPTQFSHGSGGSHGGGHGR